MVVRNAFLLWSTEASSSTRQIAEETLYVISKHDIKLTENGIRNVRNFAGQLVGANI